MKKVKRICQYCGKEYYGYEKSKYCSKECRKEGMKPQLVELVCECCGKHYMGTPIGGNRKHLYCSEECRRKLKNRAKQLKLIDERQETLSQGIEGEDYVVCQICGYKAVQLNNAHLMNEHGITITEYKEQFPDAQITASKFVEEHLKGENNPMHTSKRTEEERKQNSPFSKEFYESRGLTEEDRRAFIDKVVANKTPESYTVKLEYFTSRGYTIEEAIELRRQMHAFTLEKCIQKYGYEEGLRVYDDRQERWMQSFHASNKKHPATTGNGVSKVANEFIAKVLEGLDESQFYFGDNEYIIRYCGHIFSYDLTNLETMRIIEFNGDMWHGNPEIYSADDRNPFNHKLYEDIWFHDSHRKYVAGLKGFEVMVVWEHDYMLYPEQMIEQARHFLLNKPLPSCSI